MSFITSMVLSLMLSTNYQVYHYDPLYAKAGEEVEVPAPQIIDLTKIKRVNKYF